MSSKIIKEITPIRGDVSIIDSVPIEFISSLSIHSSQGKQFVISTGDLAGTAGTEVSRVLIKNPLGSGKTLKIFKVEEQCNTSTGNAMYRYYYNPTITINGTIMSKNNILINGPASTMQAFLNPTASLFGTRINNTIAGQMTTLIRENEYLYILPENSSLLINVRTNAGTTTWCINVYWIEE